MSKPRGKSKLPAASAAADDRPPIDLPPSESAAHSAPSAWWLAAGAGLATAVYLLVFFWQDLLPQADRSYQRFLIFAHLLTPDDLALGWVEGNWRNFAILDRWPVALCALGVLVYLALPLGWVIVHWRVDWTRVERIVFALGIGLHLLSLIVAGFGMVGGFRGSFILLLLFPPIIIFPTLWFFSRKVKHERDRVVLGEEEQFTPGPFVTALQWLLRVVIGLSLVAILLGGMLPPWDFDVREYHLQAPKEWMMQGRITFLPHNIYGNMPLGAEMHSVLPMRIFASERHPGWWPLWWGSLTGKLVMACYGPLTALTLYAAGRRFFSKLAGLSAAAVYLSSPWVLHVCVNGLNESALGFYLITAIYAALPFRDGRRAAGLSGFLAGAAASCKYPALLFVVFPLAIYLLIADVNWKGGTRRIIEQLAGGRMAVFLACMLLSCGLWYAKNWALTGNPVYPLLSGALDGKTRTPEKTAQWNRAHRIPPYTPTELAKSVARVGWKDELQSPLLIPLSLLGIAALVSAARKKNLPASSTLHPALCTPHSFHVLAVTSALLLFFLAAWWLFTHRIDRFLVPAIPLAALLAGAGVEFARTRPLKYVVAGLLVIGVTYNLLMAASPFVGDNRWFVSLERLRTDDPRQQGQISRVKAAHRWLNENIKPGETVLCVADAAVFDLEMPVFYNTCFDDCLLVSWMEGKSPEERRAEFRSRNVSFVYFDQLEFQRYTSPSNYGYDPRFSPQLLSELVSQGVLKRPLTDAPPYIYPVTP